MAMELTFERLKKMAPYTIFVTGYAFDKQDDLFMANTGKKLRWIAVRGNYHDWAIYCHFAEHDEEWVRRHGDKVCLPNHIQKLVPCDSEAFKMYRY
jgi:hypothetical protein